MKIKLFFFYLLTSIISIFSVSASAQIAESLLGKWQGDIVLSDGGIKGKGDAGLMLQHKKDKDKVTLFLSKFGSANKSWIITFTDPGIAYDETTETLSLVGDGITDPSGNLARGMYHLTILKGLFSFPVLYGTFNHGEEQKQYYTELILFPPEEYKKLKKDGYSDAVTKVHNHMAEEIAAYRKQEEQLALQKKQEEERKRKEEEEERLAKERAEEEAAFENALRDNTKIDPILVTMQSDKNFKWIEWEKIPEAIKEKTKLVETSRNTNLYGDIQDYIRDYTCKVRLAIIDLNNNGIYGFAVSADEHTDCCGYVGHGCIVGFYEDGGGLASDLGQDHADAIKPANNAVISSAGLRFPMKPNKNITTTKAEELKKLFKYK